jgi:hypothetical protein
MSSRIEAVVKALRDLDSDERRYLADALHNDDDEIIGVEGLISCFKNLDSKINSLGQYDKLAQNLEGIGRAISVVDEGARRFYMVKSILDKLRETVSVPPTSLTHDRLHWSMGNLEHPLGSFEICISSAKGGIHDRDSTEYSVTWRAGYTLKTLPNCRIPFRSTRVNLSGDFYSDLNDWLLRVQSYLQKAKSLKKTPAYKASRAKAKPNNVIDEDDDD